MKLNEIANYVIKGYPNSCFAINAKSYPHMCDDAEELYSFFAYELIGICSCGQPENAMRMVRNYLRYVGAAWGDRESVLEKGFGVKSVYDNELLLFMAYILDEKDLTDHGSGIGGAWITEMGKMCLTVLEACDLGDENDT